jgi:hypothetical protein
LEADAVADYEIQTLANEIQALAKDPITFEASKPDPGTLCFNEATNAKDSWADFKKAMLQEVIAHTKNDNWEVCEKAKVPAIPKEPTHARGAGAPACFTRLSQGIPDDDILELNFVDPGENEDDPLSQDPVNQDLPPLLHGEAPTQDEPPNPEHHYPPESSPCSTHQPNPATRSRIIETTYAVLGDTDAIEDYKLQTLAEDAIAFAASKSVPGTLHYNKAAQHADLLTKPLGLASFVKFRFAIMDGKSTSPPVYSSLRECDIISILSLWCQLRSLTDGQICQVCASTTRVTTCDLKHLSALDLHPFNPHDWITLTTNQSITIESTYQPPKVSRQRYRIYSYFRVIYLCAFYTNFYRWPRLLCYLEHQSVPHFIS